MNELNFPARHSKIKNSELSFKKAKFSFQNYLLLFLILTFPFQNISAQKTDGLSQSKPNILLIVSDDLNTRIGPFMEIENHTPELDKLSKVGVRFTRAYSQFPLCGPSRASFMSGLYPETNGVLGNDDTPGSYKKETPALAYHPSMAGFFRQHGYFTARVSKIYHMGVPGGIERGEPGGDEPDSWDYAYNVMAPETMSPGKLELLSPKNPHYGSNFSRMILDDGTEKTQTDYLAANQAIAILENRTGKVPENGTNEQRLKKDAPFFLAVGFVRPHVPLIAPKNCYDPYPANEVILPPFRIGENVPEEAILRQNYKIWGMDELQQRQAISSYMASVRFMDQQVGRVLDALDRLKLRNETIVIFMSDHGFNLGEHDCWGKVSLWEGSIRAPLIISAPGYKNNYGISCSTITELIDLYPTLVDICGFSDQKPEILQGKSLIAYLKESKAEDNNAFAYTISNGGKNASLRTQKFRYTRWSEKAESGKEELYDHENDSEEQYNLADNAEYKDILEEMRVKFEKTRVRAKTGLQNHKN
jgi:arylsulfatase A-like enzyme